MKKLIFIVLAALIILLVGYAGVASLEKRFDESKMVSEGEGIHVVEVKKETGAFLISNSTEQNDTEVIKCSQTEIDYAEANTSQLPMDDSERIRLGSVDFITSFGSGLDEAKLKGRSVFVYFRSESCGWCKKFEAEVLTDQRVISLLENSYVSISIDIYRQRDVTSEFKVRGTPTMVFLDEELEEIRRVPGFVDAETFVSILNKIENN